MAIAGIHFITGFGMLVGSLVMGDIAETKVIRRPWSLSSAICTVAFIAYIENRYIHLLPESGVERDDYLLEY